MCSQRAVHSVALMLNSTVAAVLVSFTVIVSTLRFTSVFTSREASYPAFFLSIAEWGLKPNRCLTDFVAHCNEPKGMHNDANSTCAMAE